MDRIEQVNYDKMVLTLGLAGLVSAADNWVVSPILPAIAQSFFITIPWAGLILSAYLLPYGFMQPLYGFVGDRIGKLKILRYLTLGLSIGTLACAISPFFWVLCFFRLLTGAFAAGIIALSLAIIGDEIPSSLRHKYVGKFMGVVFLGQGLSVSLSSFLADYVNWHIIFIILSIVTMLAYILLNKLSVISIINYKSQSIAEEVIKVLAKSKARTIFLYAVMTGFFVLGLYGYLGSYFNKTLMLSTAKTGVIMSSFGFTCLITGMNLEVITKRVTRRYMLIYGVVIAFFSSILLILYPHLTGALISTICLGLSYIMIQSTLASSAFEVVSEAKGLPSALVGMGLFSGGGLGTLVGSYILSIWNYQILFISFSGGLVLYILSIFSTREI